VFMLKTKINNQKTIKKYNLQVGIKCLQKA